MGFKEMKQGLLSQKDAPEWGGGIFQVRIVIFLKGRYSKVFDSQIDNLSDIKVFDSTDEIIAEVDIEDLL